MTNDQIRPICKIFSLQPNSPTGINIKVCRWLLNFSFNLYWTIHVIKCIERGHMKRNSWKYVVMWALGERESLVRVLNQFDLSVCPYAYWFSQQCIEPPPFTLVYPKTTKLNDSNVNGCNLYKHWWQHLCPNQ